MSQTDIASASPARGTGNVLLAMLAMLLVARTPAWIAGADVPWSEPTLIAMLAGSGVLMIGLPLVIRQFRPKLASFELTWLHVSWREIMHVLMVSACLLGWSVLSGILIAWVQGRHIVGIQLAHRFFSPGYIAISAGTCILLLPLAEEVFWRGYALDQLTEVFGARTALIVQAVGFSVMHFRPLGYSFVLLGGGLILGAWRQWKRCLLPLVVAHVLMNAVVLGPTMLEGYHESSMVLMIEREGLGDFQSFYAGLQNSPEVKRIDALRFQPDDKAVPAIIRYLGSPNESVRLYAAAALDEGYGKRGSRHYRQALHSSDPNVVSSILTVIDLSHCHDLVPDVRAVAMQSKDLHVQVGAVTTLEDLGDAEGLQEIAEKHPSANIRRMAEQFARMAQEVREEHR